MLTLNYKQANLDAIIRIFKTNPASPHHTHLHAKNRKPHFHQCIHNIWMDPYLALVPRKWQVLNIAFKVGAQPIG